MQMINIRLKFVKGPETKYISHLDLVRTFQRALRRAHVPMVYSQGFNPHPEMSFASALGIGVTSLGEYLDIGVNENISTEEIISRLNNTMPAGLQIEKAVILKEKAKSAMALVSHARYTIHLCFDNSIDIDSSLASFLEQDSIPAMKEQPKKNFQLIEIDIRPMIKELKLLSQEGSKVVLDCLLYCGSKANLKPELLLQALGKHMKETFEIEKIERVELYTDVTGKITSLLFIDNAG